MGTLPNFKELSVAHETTQLDKIGQGSCATVWAAPCSNCNGHGHLALKQEGDSSGRSLSHEYRIHQKLLRAYTLVCLPFEIPRCFGFLDSKDSAWDGILPRLHDTNTRRDAIVSEKINPVPVYTRRLLVHRFRADIDEEKVMNNLNNEHCLIRPYLTRRKYRPPAPDSLPRKRVLAFSLQNFPLHLGRMEQLGLDPREYAIAMADALAFMHWVARVDGNDVEYVLGRPRSPPSICCQHHQKSSQDAYPHNTRILGAHTMWILDFDMCRDLTLDESGVEQACNAFWGNDSWYPLPGRSVEADQKLWDLFEHRFLESSAKSLGTRSGRIGVLPSLLMEKIKQTAMDVSKDEFGDW